MKFSKIVFLLLITSLFATESFAQFKNYANLMSFNMGYGTQVTEYTGNSLTSYSFDFTYEGTNMTGDMSGGVMIAYQTAHDEDEEEGDDQRQINYQTIPILLHGKFLFGSPMVKFYLQGGIGWQFSRIEYASPVLLLADGDSGFAFLLGAGANFFTSEKFFIHAAYNFSYLSNSFYQDGIVHTLKIGIGFQTI